ncbi:unnamed protein product, partial [Staurois parvus]
KVLLIPQQQNQHHKPWFIKKDNSNQQGRTDNSWGLRAIGDHGAPVPLPKLKKAYEKRYQGHLRGPPTDPGPLGSARVSKWSVRPW